ncbi:MAG TPA: DUF1918 domain-containing protein [Actinomycetes bacterium]|nr:DUF1918 domain-containing protein [Actinomycetes bacterium]
MKASVGDRIVIASARLDSPVRDGRVVEVRHEDGSPPYVVEWSDTGQTGLFFPGPDAYVVSENEGASPPEPRPARRVRSWSVRIDLVEEEAETTAHAILLSGAPMSLDAQGAAHRRPGESDVPEIGDELAVARALRRLSDLLLGAAETDLTAAEGRAVNLPG